MLSVDKEEPETFIYNNPSYVRDLEIPDDEQNELDIDTKLNSLIKKNLNNTDYINNILLNLNKSKKQEIKNSDEELSYSINKFENSVFNLIFEFTNDSEENKRIFLQKIQSSNNINLKRMYYLHILGGESSASHFFNKNGTYKTSSQIEKEVLHIIKSQSIELSNYLISRKTNTGDYNSGYDYKTYIIINTLFKFNKLIYYISNFIKKKIDYKGILFLYALIYYLLRNYSWFISISGLSLLILIKLIFNFIELENFKTDFIYYTQNKDLSEEFKLKIYSFSNEFIKLDKEVNILKTQPDSILIEKINKYISTTDHFLSSKKSKLGSFLIKSLKNITMQNEFYLESIKNNLFIPLSIYFFNSVGEPRTIREIICSIIIISQNFNIKQYLNLKTSNIITKEDKNNLLKEFIGGQTKKKTKLKTKETQNKKNKTYKLN
jgi:hypothetical protein